MLETEAFSISRDLKAPRALVYEVQTDAKHLANWLSPEGFKTIHAAMDFRVGGSYHYGLEGPGGMQMWGLQRFREIVADRKDRAHPVVLRQGRRAGAASAVAGMAVGIVIDDNF